MDMIIGQKPGAPGARPAPPPRPAPPHHAPPHNAPPGPVPAAAAPVPLSELDMIVDGNQATFMQDVIEVSRSIPVLVDFWATWCGPCKTLTPALERVVRAAGGRVKLVKIDIDANRPLVQQLTQLGLPLQSVPTVAAFWQGQIADIIQGALPESELRRFVEALLKMAGGTMPGADLLAEARAAAESGDHAGAGELFSAMLEQEPESPEAWGGLIRALVALGQEDQAHQALDEVPPKIAVHAEIEGARSALALAEQGRAARGQLSGLQARLAANADDHQARYDMATALAAGGQHGEAADALLDIIRRDRTWNDEAARHQLLQFFAAWGNADPATMAARRKLSAVLFS